MKSQRLLLVGSVLMVGAMLRAVPAKAQSVQSTRLTESLTFPTPPAYKYRALDDSARDADYWQQVGINAFLLGDYHNALVAYNKAVDLSVDHVPEMLEQRSWIHYRIGNLRPAINDIQEAARLHWIGQNYDRYHNARETALFMHNQVTLSRM